MISLFVITILILAGVFAIKMNHLRHKFFILMLIVLALFLYSTITLVTNQNQLDLSTSEGLFSSMKLYVGWLANGFTNLKSLSGNAIKMDWVSTNGSFTNKSNVDKS